MMATQPIIYCDMDGVLCDFFSAVQRLTDKPIKSLSVSQMWALCREQADFWENLEWMDGGRSVWKVVAHYRGHILSSLPYSDPNSGPGKRKWLRNNIGLSDPERIHLVNRRSKKQNFAISNQAPNILIDDFFKNTNEWQAAGGNAILHVSLEDTLLQLRELGINTDLQS